MSDKIQLICALVVEMIFLCALIHTMRELCTPRYIKSKSFLKMGDVETPLANGWTSEPIATTHSYIDECGSDMFAMDIE